MDFVHDTQQSIHASVGRPCSAAECVSLQDQTVGKKKIQIGQFVVDYELSAYQRSILQRLSKFYTPALIDDVLRPAIDQQQGGEQHGPSLRTLDWLTGKQPHRPLPSPPQNWAQPCGL